MGLVLSPKTALCAHPPTTQPRSCAHPRASRIRSIKACASAHKDTSSCTSAGRRQMLAGIGASLVLQQQVAPGASQAAVGIEILSDTEGFGLHAVQDGDLVLVHYTGVLQQTGQVFDSTQGYTLGLKYRDGGRGVYRPLAFRLSGYPQPGVCEGLQQALVGMKIGGQRSVLVDPALGFGNTDVLAPYAAVPAGSKLRYDVELVRVSALGPDAMMKGITQCSAGGASASADNCANVEAAEFF